MHDLPCRVWATATATAHIIMCVCCVVWFPLCTRCTRLSSSSFRGKAFCFRHVRQVQLIDVYLLSFNVCRLVWCAFTVHIRERQKDINDYTIILLSFHFCSTLCGILCIFAATTAVADICSLRVASFGLQIVFTLPELLSFSAKKEHPPSTSDVVRFYDVLCAQREWVKLQKSNSLCTFFRVFSFNVSTPPILVLKIVFPWICLMDEMGVSAIQLMVNQTQSLWTAIKLWICEELITFRWVIDWSEIVQDASCE